MLRPTTLSTCSPESEQGRHVFEITGYSKHKGMGHGPGSFIRSATFPVGGHSWSIRYYPDGYARANTSEDDYISVYLELMSIGSSVRASCDLRLVDQTTGLSSTVHKTELRMFNPSDSSKFAPKANKLFKKRSELEASAYLGDDRLTIECVVTVMKKPKVLESKPRPKIQVPPSDITQHLGNLLEQGERADVTFSVGEHSFAAHRIVLAARSPVFEAELHGPMREAGTQTVTVQGIQPAVFKALLHFIYTDSLPAMDGLEGDDRVEMIRNLLVAADRYGVGRLKIVCQSILCEDLDARNVATTLALADLHHCEMLKDACFEFIFSSRMDDVVHQRNPFVNMIQYFKRVLGASGAAA
ncbi:BTB/POZ and MATH domain-containing protein 1-like [Panicum miliaceum]|uniref:BTB/POZ and MATH domain-containing protein 1-like n=1 Tax=Panicum miliaceum TaxID=4540 RepID=A0A3L6RGA6_PANMI|nr:BTB/POZ and MATH domain-containing protein 1-like [Panicum miliaceum]